MIALLIALVLGVPNPPHAVPFCAALNSSVAPVVIVQAHDNDAIAHIFPALLDYHSSMKDQNIARASIDIYRLKKVLAQLQADQPQLQRMLKSPPALRAPVGSERELFDQVQVGLNSVLAEQQGIERALSAFVNEEESAEDATLGRVTMAASKATNTQAAQAEALGSDSASRLMAAAASASSVGNLNDIVYARPMVANSQQIVDQESYLHNLMNLSIEDCYVRRQPAKPAPTHHP